MNPPKKKKKSVLRPAPVWDRIFGMRTRAPHAGITITACLRCINDSMVECGNAGVGITHAQWALCREVPLPLLLPDGVVGTCGSSDAAAPATPEASTAMTFIMWSGSTMLMVGMPPADLFASTVGTEWMVVEEMAGPGSSERFVGSEMNDNELAMLDIPRLRVIETSSMMALALADLTKAISAACDATAASMADWRSEMLPYVGDGAEAKATVLTGERELNGSPVYNAVVTTAFDCWTLPSTLQMLSAQGPPHVVVLVVSPAQVVLHCLASTVTESTSLFPQKHWVLSSVPAIGNPCALQKLIHCSLVIPLATVNNWASLSARAGLS